MNDLKTSPLGISLIKGFEKLRLQAYDDNGKAVGGKWTIGYGATYYANGAPVKEGDEITAGEAGLLLAHDLGKFEKMVKSKITIPLLQHQFDALVDFCYNTGGGYTKAGLHKDYDLFKNINAGMPQAELQAYWEGCAVTQAGVKLGGLVRRRKAEYYLFLTGEVNFFE